MSATDKDIKRVISNVLAEAKKKKEKAEVLKHDPKPAAYGYSEAFDFSAPLGAYNLYRSQGAVNWGPMTGPGSKIDDKIVGQRANLEQVLHGIVKEVSTPSAWAPLIKESAENIEEGPWDYLKNLGGQAKGAAGKALGKAGQAVGNKVAAVKKGAQDVHAKAQAASASADKTKSTQAAKAGSLKVVRGVIPQVQHAEEQLTQMINALDGDESEQMVARAIDTLSGAGDALNAAVASIEGVKAAAPGQGRSPIKSRLPARPQARQGTPPAMNVKAR